MKQITLGGTGIAVTELCFGALPIGPLQKNVDIAAAGEVIAHALESGVDYIDTAAMYGTYPHIRLALEKTHKQPVISSKSTAADYDGMMRDVLLAREALGVDCIDIFFLHAARVSDRVFRDRDGAVRALLACKEKGWVKAAGISTHDVTVTALAAKNPEMDVVFPIINKLGRGVIGGTLAEMEHAVEDCFDAGKGVVLMKVLGGGSLIGDYQDAMAYSMGISQGRAAIALGMVSKAEVDMNAAYFNGADIAEQADALRKPDKQLFIVDMLCAQCGACERACHSGAIARSDGKMRIDNEKCLTCGYCAGACEQFAIRMI